MQVGHIKDIGLNAANGLWVDNPCFAVKEIMTPLWLYRKERKDGRRPRRSHITYLNNGL